MMSLVNETTIIMKNKIAKKATVIKKPVNNSIKKEISIRDFTIYFED